MRIEWIRVNRCCCSLDGFLTFETEKGGHRNGERLVGPNPNFAILGVHSTMKQRRVLLGALLCVVIAASTGVEAQQVPAAVISDPAPDPTNPATLAWPDIPSHGAKVYAVIYEAAGAGPHPTVLLMPGFPGNEKNLDLAYSMRRAGWNVLQPYYRGSWGSGGAFSFTNALEDTQAVLEFVRNPENAKKYRVDAKRLVLIGHSFGGFVVAYVGARDPGIMAVGMIAASNFGPSTMRALAKDPQELHARFADNASRLAGTSPEALLEEVKKNLPNWNYLDYAPALKDRPILVLEADDRNLGDNRAMAAALRKLGNARVTEKHIAADHSFSEHRIAMQAIVVEWLQSLGAQKTK